MQVKQEAFEKCWAMRHNEPPHANSLDVASGNVAMSTTTTTTTTTTRDRGDCYGPMEWAQQSIGRMVEKRYALPGDPADGSWTRA